MAHIHRDIDLVVSVYIVHQSKVLLVAHKKTGMWLPVGGHVELHEDAHQALLREIQEECGLEVEIFSPPVPVVPRATDVKFLPLPSGFDIHYFDPRGEHRHMNLIYFGTSESDQVTLAAQEHDALRWFTASELTDPAWNILPSVAYYGQEALTAAAASEGVYQ